MKMKVHEHTTDYRRMDFEYECSDCNQRWATCTCPVPDPEIVAQRIAAERARLLKGEEKR